MGVFFNWGLWLIKKYNITWDKVSANIKSELYSEPVCNKFFLNIRITTNGDEVTDFYDKEIPWVGSNHTVLAVISLDSALNKDGNYYPQVFLKQRKKNSPDKKKILTANWKFSLQKKNSHKKRKILMMKG